MKVLVVGGTADGRKLATRLHELSVNQPRLNIIYSIAGIVRKATVPCAVISGGFTQFGGLDKYITNNKITHIVDATHPFAQTMSNKIAQVSQTLSIPAIRFHRQQWKKKSSDQWIEVNEWSELIGKIKGSKHLFLTAGQVSQSVIDLLSEQTECLILRTAMPPKVNLPANVVWLKAIGPFRLEDEKQLLNQYKIDAIVSKNSGGDATYAKIQAAAEAGIPVYQFKRPDLKPLLYQFDNESDCIQYCIQQLNQSLCSVSKTVIPTHTEFKYEI